MLILFDLDGTVLRCRVGADAFTDACAEVLGVSISRAAIPFAGGTDPVLFDGVCSAHGVAPNRDLTARFHGTYLDLLRSRLSGATEALPGVIELVTALRGVAAVTCGILTGNYRESGLLKLEAAGLDPADFPVQVFGDDGRTRNDLPEVALQRYRLHAGGTPTPERAVIVGDTPKDVACARHSGLRVLAVATGPYDRGQLLALDPDLVVDDLTRTAELVAWLTDPGIAYGH